MKTLFSKIGLTKNKLTRFVAILLIVSAVVGLQTPTVYALLPFTQYDLDKIYDSQTFQDGEVKEEARCGPSTGQSVNNSVFYIGDSLTVGMVTSGSLLEKTSVAGFTVNTAYEKVGNRVFGSSVEATSGYTIDRTIPKLSEHAQDINSQNAGIIVIGLGTNPEGNFTNKAVELVDFIRGFNSSAKIFWVNTYFTPGVDTYKTVNAEIEAAAEQKDFTVIDFATEAASNDGLALAGDGYHHSPQAYGNKSDFILSKLPGSNSFSDSSVSCGRSLSGDNEKDVFDILVNDYGFTPEQAAGVIGNMRHESSVQPMRLQGTPSGTETPSSTVDIPGTRGIGWGLVQWTPTAKIIEQSFIRAIPYEQIDTIVYQLEFLVGQLRGDGIGGEVSSEKTRAGDPFFASKTAEEAASIFAVRYERCANCQEGSAEVQKRIDDAVDVLIRVGSL